VRIFRQSRFFVERFDHLPHKSGFCFVAATKLCEYVLKKIALGCWQAGRCSGGEMHAQVEFLPHLLV
jgi:hypothetical protein